MFTFSQSPKIDATTASALRIQALRWNHRRIPLSRSRHITGRYSPGPGRALVPFESRTECRAIAFLFDRFSVSVILAQPLTIEYHTGGRRRRYTPDLLVIAEHITPALSRSGFGQLTFVEVKGAIDSESRVIADAKLQLVKHATGLPAILMVDAPAGPVGEVCHEH